MIIVRSPLRISIAGGGTDIPSYYKLNESYFISAAINKYIYISITQPFEKGIYLKYSRSETVRNPNLIKHKIFKEVLRKEKNLRQIEITLLQIYLLKLDLVPLEVLLLDLLKQYIVTKKSS